MDPATLGTIVSWFAQPAANALFDAAKEHVLRRLGVYTSSSQREPYLDHYLQKWTARLDEDRISKLYGAFSRLIDAPKSIAAQSLLIEALNGFHEVARIPEQGMTGDHSNAELRCMAFIGMVAVYSLLNDRKELIEEKMVEAIYTDVITAKQWLGESLVDELTLRFPSPAIICSQCGFHNPVGSFFCGKDGYALNTNSAFFSRLFTQASHSVDNPYVPWGTLIIDENAHLPLLKKSRTSSADEVFRKQGKGIQVYSILRHPDQPPERFTDFTLQVKMVLISPRKPDNARAGIFFGANSWATKYFYFSLSADHTYSLDLITWWRCFPLGGGKISFIDDNPILLGLVVQRFFIDLYANYQHIYRLNHQYNISGYAGIAIGDPKAQRYSEAQYSQLKMWIK